MQIIIVDEHAESSLTKALEDIRAQPETGVRRLLHFKWSGLLRDAIGQDIRNKIAAAAQKHTPDASMHIYFCKDRDVFILASMMSPKDARQLIFDLAIALHFPPTQDFAELHDVHAHIHKLLLLVEEKSENHRKETAAVHKQQAMEQLKRKRHAILNQSLPVQAQGIAARRKKRGKPELMMIEDDAFSRHLVENVFQNQFPLTTLADADLALPTYAQKAPDVLFLDINLPDVTGHELLEKIIALDPEAYVIMLSANSDEANIMRAMKAGAKGFIGKPFNREKLFQYIDRCPTVTVKKGEAYA